MLGIAATGSVFELSYGDPDLGVTTTRWILGLASLPATIGSLLGRDSLEQTGLNPKTKPVVTFTIPTHPSAPMARLRIAAAALAVFGSTLITGLNSSVRAQGSCSPLLRSGRIEIRSGGSTDRFGAQLSAQHL